MTTTEWRKINPNKNKEARKKEKIARSSNKERNRRCNRWRRNWQKRVNRMIIRNAKNKPCVDCGKQFPFFMMEFDHVRGKSMNISECASKHVSQLTLLNEIAKCEVVCANCHRARTYFRQPEDMWE